MFSFLKKRSKPAVTRRVVMNCCDYTTYTAKKKLEERGACSYALQYKYNFAIFKYNMY